MTLSRLCLPSALLLSLLPTQLRAQSYYPQKPPEPLAVTLGSAGFEAHGDGADDDADTLQAAINHVQETTHHGLVLIPSGRYRLGRTVHVWAGIRLIGYGPERPVFVLGPHTPGFQAGQRRHEIGGSQPVIWFTDERPAVGAPIPDASEFTFYSAMSNIDFDLGEGNEAAVAVRFNVAQHSFLTHMNFRVGTARAAIEAVGNQASDLHIFGGQFGIITRKTSPAWQFLLMDSTFEGQRDAAIQTDEAGFTLVRDRFRDVPVAIRIPPGQVEQLYGRDLQMERISRAVLEVGDTQNLRSEITLERVACTDVGRFVNGFNTPAMQGSFVQDSFSLGLEIGPDGRERGVVAQHREHQGPAPARLLATDIPPLPPMSTWADVRSLGAKGDGGTDDTALLQHAIDTHRTLFFPAGLYRLTGSLHLRPDTVLIGMSPFTTEFTVSDHAPEFAGAGDPLPLVVSARGGSSIVTGIGIATGFGNPRAAGILWLAGEHSMVEDIDFIRGHNENNPLLAPAAPVAPLGGPRPASDLDSQFPSLWVRDGGGGIFRGIWSHAGTAAAGLQGENTSTPAVFYQFSCEHHLRREVRLDHVRNWRFYDLQTEEENPDGADAVAVDLEATHDVLFADTFMYRVSRNIRPKRYAITADDSADVEFAAVKIFSQTRLAFDNSIFDAGSGVTVRAHDFNHFALTARLGRGRDLPTPAVFAPNAKLRRLATGFSNASGLTSDSAGQVYFTDAANHSIFHWNAGSAKAELLAKEDGSPQVLGFVAPSTLLVINNEKSVMALDTPLGASPKPVSGAETPVGGTVLLLPGGMHNHLEVLDLMLAHRGYVFRVGSNTAIRSDLLTEGRQYFYAGGTKTAIMAGGTWRPLLQSSQLVPFAVGARHLIASEDDAQTWRAELLPGEKLQRTLFVERGGSAVVSDTAGNVYLAGDQVYVYDPSGKQTGILEVPERPSSLAFGGPDRRTLYVGARGSLYSIETSAPGQ